ncbi:ATP-binding cassette domain-containing protein [Geomicrobium sp. JSM 1781026]|uniref:ATP-binding cassette domain-containing protein n=1 Tax=Geomicrobium sp. JSM 1781026 TaxID=3344580 RepID=UPI0035C23117
MSNVSKLLGGLEAIRSVSLSIEKGDVYGRIGASGTGKSKLLRIMNLLEMPDVGEVRVNCQDLTGLSSKELRNARKSIDMIFQHFNLGAKKRSLKILWFRSN